MKGLVLYIGACGSTHVLVPGIMVQEIDVNCLPVRCFSRALNPHALGSIHSERQCYHLCHRKEMGTINI